MPDLKASETAKNLMRAFAGECQARARYTFAAELAKAQKMPMVEAVLQYTANQEKEHAEIFYKYLEPLDKETIVIDGGYPVDAEQNTLAQLRAAAHNEYEEHDVVYRSFGEIAEKEGFSQIAASFRMIAEIEKTHGDRFSTWQICCPRGICLREVRRPHGYVPTAVISASGRRHPRNARCAIMNRDILPERSWLPGFCRSSNGAGFAGAGQRAAPFLRRRQNWFYKDWEVCYNVARSERYRGE